MKKPDTLGSGTPDGSRRVEILKRLRLTEEGEIAKIVAMLAISGITEEILELYKPFLLKKATIGEGAIIDLIAITDPSSPAYIPVGELESLLEKFPSDRELTAENLAEFRSSNTSKDESDEINQFSEIESARRKAVEALT